MKPALEEDKPHNCPHCKTSLLEKEIPDDIKHHYSGNYFKREIGVEDPMIYDGVLYWQCPDCKGEWGRWIK